MTFLFLNLSIVIPSKAKESHNVLSNLYNAIYLITPSYLGQIYFKTGKS
jgi:hypothetical protein